jgi:hypothetical protein
MRLPHIFIWIFWALKPSFWTELILSQIWNSYWIFKLPRAHSSGSLSPLFSATRRSESHRHLPPAPSTRRCWRQRLSPPRALPDRAPIKNTGPFSSNFPRHAELPSAPSLRSCVTSEAASPLFPPSFSPRLDRGKLTSSPFCAGAHCPDRRSVPAPPAVAATECFDTAGHLGWAPAPSLPQMEPPAAPHARGAATPLPCRRAVPRVKSGPGRRARPMLSRMHGPIAVVSQARFGQPASLEFLFSFQMIFNSRN